MNVIYILKNLKELNKSKDQFLNDPFPLCMSSAIEKINIILPYSDELKAEIIDRLAFRCDLLSVDSLAFTESKKIKIYELQYSKNVKIYLLKPENYNFFLPDNKIEDDIALFSLSALKLINTYIKDSDMIHIVDNSAILFSAYYKTSSTSSSKVIYNFNKLDDDFLLPASFIGRYNLKNNDFNPDGFEYYGNISFVKSAIFYSDATTSPTTFKDNKQPMDGRIQYLLNNKNKFFNILSAIDDTSIKNKYLNSRDKFNKKMNLQNRLNLSIGKTLWFIENLNDFESQYIFELLSNHILIHDDEFVILKRDNNEILYKLRNKFPERVSIIESSNSDTTNIIAAADFLLLNNNSNKLKELFNLAVTLGTVVVGIFDNSEFLKPLEPNLRIGNSITSSDINDLPLLLKKGSYFSKKDLFLNMQKRLLDRTNNCKLMTGNYKNLYKKLISR